jgi:UDP-N-acetylmuramoyl-tripeptide--D-alanyl-D-alanine ligase
MNLHQINAIVGGTLIGKPIHFRGISTDSRKDCTGTLFVALKGENFNGEDYCQQAINSGAIAVLVSCAQDINVSQIICDDSLQALSVLAKNWANQCQAKIIAITGSNGKTTVKNMIRSILSISHQCMATRGNLNNEIGVPLSLCEIHPNDKYAIIEMGAAQLGDISKLVSLVNIDISVLTNVSAAHIGRFGSLANIISEKAQIFSMLDETKTAILPHDDDNFNNWKHSAKCQVKSFGINNQADVQIADDINFHLLIENKTITNIKLPVAGSHNQLNAACAAAIAGCFAISTDDIKHGLEQFTPESGRLENMGTINGNIIINDSYNANPQSMKSAIDVLADYQTPNTLIVGDMAELGTHSKQLHEEIGDYAKQKKIANLLSIGKDSVYTSRAFSEHAQHFNDMPSLKKHLLKNWQQLGTILVKGSRSMHLEELINGLIDSEKAA